MFEYVSVIDTDRALDLAQVWKRVMYAQDAPREMPLLSEVSRNIKNNMASDVNCRKRFFPFKIQDRDFHCDDAMVLIIFKADGTLLVSSPSTSATVRVAHRDI